MKEEQEKAIERCKELIKQEHANWIGISNQIAIEEVLNMLKEKDKEIESIRYIKNNFDYVVQKEIEKKDKIIDLMAEYINEIDVSEEICEGKTMCDENCKECIKKYFKSKAEE